MAPGKCSSQSPEKGALTAVISRAGSGQGKGSLPKGLQDQRVSRLLPSPTPTIKQLLITVRVAPRTFLLRNSLTREAATSSTKRLSMLRFSHEAAAPQTQTPGPLRPVWPRCRGDGVSRAGELRPSPGSERVGKAGGKGRSILQTCSESGKQNPEGTNPVHPRHQARAPDLCVLALALSIWVSWIKLLFQGTVPISQGVNGGECLPPDS